MLVYVINILLIHMYTHTHLYTYTRHRPLPKPIHTTLPIPPKKNKQVLIWTQQDGAGPWKKTALPLEPTNPVTPVWRVSWCVGWNVWGEGKGGWWWYVYVGGWNDVGVGRSIGPLY